MKHTLPQVFDPRAQGNEEEAQTEMLHTPLVWCMPEHLHCIAVLSPYIKHNSSTICVMHKSRLTDRG